MQRSESSFTVGGINLLTRAIVQAQQWAQRKRNFELARVSAILKAVSLTAGGDLSNLKLYTAQTTPVVAKTLLSAFVPLNNTTDFIPVDLYSRDKHTNMLRRYYDQIKSLDPADTPVSYSTRVSVVRFANTVYVRPSDTTIFGGSTSTDIAFDIVKWLPAYSSDTDTDFLLDYCEDFMLFRSVFMLNFMIKEDARVPVDIEALRDTWQSVVEWDSSLLLNSVEDTSLD